MKTNVMKKLIVFGMIVAALLLNVVPVAGATVSVQENEVVMVASDMKPRPEPHSISFCFKYI